MTQAIRLLPIAFVFTGVVTLFDRAFNDEMRRLSGVRQEFTDAVGDAKGRLTANVWSALSDGQIQQNFELGNINTVTQSLQGYLRPGEVSQIDLFDGDCNLLARVPQNGRPFSEICPLIKAGKPALVWQQNDQKEAVLVAVAVKNISGRPVFAAGELVFDQSWLSLHYGLATLFAEREINLGNGGGADLWREGKQSDGHYALALRVDGWIYRIIPELTGLAIRPVDESFWVVFGALGIILLIALSSISSQLRKDQIERGQFESWVRGHLTTRASGGASANAEPKSWSELLVAAQGLLASRDEQKEQHLRLMSERLESAANRLREREIEVAELRGKIADMSDLASLQQQLRHTTSSFLRQMGQMREICENIYDLATAGLSRQARDLHAFCARWKEGISQGSNRDMAARKFFRSLVETRGTVPGSTLLDDDMRNLELLTTATLDQSLHAAVLARQAIEDCEAASQLAALWHGISTRDQSAKSSDWISCLSSAQKLVNADDRYKAITFESLPQLGKPEEMYPAVTSSALVSGFFHLYLALLVENDRAFIDLPLVVRQKRFKEQGTIILSLPSRQSTTVPEVPTRQMMYHLDIAKQILSAAGLKVSILPPTAAGYPVSVSWSLPNRTSVVTVQRSVREGAESSVQS